MTFLTDARALADDLTALRRGLHREPEIGLDLPRTQAEVNALLAEVRTRGVARVVDTLLPGIVGFCAPVFDADGHMALGIVTLGSIATFDPEWGGAVERPLRSAALQLSQDLGWRAH